MIDNEILRKGECDGLLPELSAYIDGELDSVDAQCIEAHLEKCEKCRKKLSGLSLLSKDIGEAFVPYPKDLHLRIMNALDEEMKNGRKKSRAVSFGKAMKKHGMWIGAGVAAVICLVLVGSPFFRGDFALNKDDAKNFAAEADAIMPQNGGIEAACNISPGNATGGAYYAADDAEELEVCTKQFSLYSSTLTDGAEISKIKEESCAEKSDHIDLPEAEAAADAAFKDESDAFTEEYCPIPIFLLPRGELGPLKTELYH